jgi:hypothetical protein
LMRGESLTCRKRSLKNRVVYDRKLGSQTQIS